MGSMVPRHAGAHGVLISEMAGKSFTKRIAMAAALLVAVAGVAWWLFARPNADARARRFASALSDKDWGTIYDMASETEKSRQTWDRSNFVSLMSEISDRRIKEVGPIETKGDWGGQTTWKMFAFRFDVLQPDGLSQAVTLMVPFYRGPDDWHPSIYALPLHLHNLKKAPTRTSLRMLLEACRRANVDSLARLDDNLVFSMERLAQYLDRKATWASIYTHRASL